MQHLSATGTTNALELRDVSKHIGTLAAIAELRNACMVKARQQNKPTKVASKEPAIGIMMFGVTTSCVLQRVEVMDKQFDTLVFHVNSIGGQSMESLIDNGRIAAVLDITKLTRKYN